MLTGKPHQIGFGVAGTVPASDYSVLCLQQHLMMFIYQQRAKRMIAVIACLSRNGYGSLEMLKVSIVQENILYIISLIIADSESCEFLTKL